MKDLNKALMFVFMAIGAALVKWLLNHLGDGKHL